MRSKGRRIKKSETRVIRDIKTIREDKGVIKNDEKRRRKNRY